MKTLSWLTAFAALSMIPAQAGTLFSGTGSLGTPEDVFVEPFTLAAAATVTVQTYGFGGGINADGAVIPSGGFDALVALFSGSPTAATILTDVSGNPFASADNSLSYSPGCPPAGTIAVGTVSDVCGDNTLVENLAAGSYTLLLTDANLVPLAVNPSIVLGPYDLTDTSSNTYNDLSGGVFQTCASSTDCNTDNGNFAVDIIGSGTVTPEPATCALFGAGLLGLILIRSRCDTSAKL
jgi:hypothetical protein